MGYNIHYFVGHYKEECQDHRHDCQIQHGGQALIPDLGSR